MHNDKASVPGVFNIQIQPYILNFIGKVTVSPSKINCVNGKAPSSSKLSLRRDRAIGQRPRIHHTNFSCPNVSPFSHGMDDGVQTRVTTLYRLLEGLNGVSSKHETLISNFRDEIFRGVWCSEWISLQRNANIVRALRAPNSSKGFASKSARLSQNGW